MTLDVLHSFHHIFLCLIKITAELYFVVFSKKNERKEVHEYPTKGRQSGTTYTKQRAATTCEAANHRMRMCQCAIPITTDDAILAVHTCVRQCHMQLTTQRPKMHTTGTPKDPSQNLSIRGKKKGIRGLFSFPSRIIPRTIGTQEPAGSASASPPTTPYYVRPTSVQCSFHFHSSTRVSIRTRQCLDSKFKIPKVSYQMVTLIRRIKYR
jgi:hypothetical protein